MACGASHRPKALGMETRASSILQERRIQRRAQQTTTATRPSRVTHHSLAVADSTRLQERGGLRRMGVLPLDQSRVLSLTYLATYSGSAATTPNPPPAPTEPTACPHAASAVPSHVRADLPGAAAGASWRPEERVVPAHRPPHQPAPYRLTSRSPHHTTHGCTRPARPVLLIVPPARMLPCAPPSWS